MKPADIEWIECWKWHDARGGFPKRPFMVPHFLYARIYRALFKTPYVLHVWKPGPTVKGGRAIYCIEHIRPPIEWRYVRTVYILDRTVHMYRKTP